MKLRQSLLTRTHRIELARLGFADVGRIVVAAVAGTSRVRGGEEVAGARLHPWAGVRLIDANARTKIGRLPRLPWNGRCQHRRQGGANGRAGCCSTSGACEEWMA